MEARKRANKNQQRILVERLRVNPMMAKVSEQSTPNPGLNQFWMKLSHELNQLGCKRSPAQWQHVWFVWMAKTRTKARKRTVNRAIKFTPAEKTILNIIAASSENIDDSITVKIESEPFQSPSESPSPKCSITFVDETDFTPTPTPDVQITEPEIEPGPSKKCAWSPDNDSIAVAIIKSARLLSRSIAQAAEIIADAIDSAKRRK